MLKKFNISPGYIFAIIALIVVTVTTRLENIPSIVLIGFTLIVYWLGYWDGTKKRR